MANEQKDQTPKFKLTIGRMIGKKLTFIKEKNKEGRDLKTVSAEAQNALSKGARSALIAPAK